MINPIVNDIKELVKKLVEEQHQKYTWYDIAGACAYSKCSRTTLFKAIRDGVLKSAKPEGVQSVKIRKDWLDRWLDN
tara:strand:+ start:215 stop:445 length:231 start_codon:yes stop_codon:yes gene_type:complete